MNIDQLISRLSDIAARVPPSTPVVCWMLDAPKLLDCHCIHGASVGSKDAQKVVMLSVGARFPAHLHPVKFDSIPTPL